MILCANIFITERARDCLEINLQTKKATELAGKEERVTRKFNDTIFRGSMLYKTN